MEKNIIKKGNIIYEQTYMANYDMTIIIKTIHEGEDIKTKISGFYYGTPTMENMETFLESN